MAAERTLIVSNTKWWMLFAGLLAERCLIFDRGDCFEIEERDHHLITRRRIFLEDILMISFHNYRRRWMITLCFGFGGLLLLPGLLLLSQTAILLNVMITLTVPLWLAGGMQLLFGTHCLCIHGKRTSAELRFTLGRTYAERCFHRLGDQVQRRHAALRQQSAPATNEATTDEAPLRTPE